MGWVLSVSRRHAQHALRFGMHSMPYVAERKFIMFIEIHSNHSHSAENCRWQNLNTKTLPK